MNFLSIEYFLVILEEGSFSCAARKLFVSQQSLSEHVKKLESELGVPLLKRGQTLTLTVAGECFVENGKEILKARDKMYRDIAFVTTKRKSKITIGVPTFDLPPFLPDILTEFAGDFPEYEAVVKKRQPADIAHNIAGIDLYFSSIPLDENLEHVLLIENDPYVIVANTKLLTNIYEDRWPEIERDLIESKDLSLLKDAPFLILIDRNGQVSRDQTIIFQNYGFSPNIGFQSENGDLNASLCIHGTGIFIASRYFCRRKFIQYLESEDNPLKLYEINTPGLHPSLALSYEKGKRLNPAEKHFIETARKYISANP